MKKIIFYFSLLLTGLVFYSCERELESENSSTGMANYPNIIIDGDQFSTILVGQAYTDKGAKAFSGVTDITSSMVTEGTVDVNTPGVYIISYSVTNDENRSLSKNRYVGVISPAAAAMDISGTYGRNIDLVNRLVTVTKTQFAGMYINNNPGGVRVNVEGDAPFFVDVYMFHTDVNVVSVPAQDTPLGTLACTNGSYDTGNNSYTWKVVNSSFGTALRTFIKQ